MNTVAVIVYLVLTFREAVLTPPAPTVQTVRILMPDSRECVRLVEHAYRAFGPDVLVSASCEYHKLEQP